MERVKLLYLIALPALLVLPFLFQNCTKPLSAIEQSSSHQSPSFIAMRSTTSNSDGTNDEVLKIDPTKYSLGFTITPEEEANIQKAFEDEKNRRPNQRSGRSAPPHLPIRQDNSTSKAFPPIIHQGPAGSCYAMSSAYYTASYELCRNIQGCDNSSPMSSQAVVISPRWIHVYNSRGRPEKGGDPFNVTRAIEAFGGVLFRDFPYNQEFFADLDKQMKILPNMNMFKEGMKYRVKHSEFIKINKLNNSRVIEFDPSSVRRLKEVLADGQIAQFTTAIFGARLGNVAYPNGVSGAREFAITHMCGYEGGHAMTIVGYDDDLWIDVNRNNKIDGGEKGAFKIANSWGSDWANHGFVWVAYDALLPVSNVSPIAAGSGAQDCSADRLPEAQAQIEIANGRSPNNPRIPFMFGWVETVKPASINSDGQPSLPRFVAELDLNSDTSFSSDYFYLLFRQPIESDEGIVALFATYSTNLLSQAGSEPTKLLLNLSVMTPENDSTAPIVMAFAHQQVSDVKPHLKSARILNLVLNQPILEITQTSQWVPYTSNLGYYQEMYSFSLTTPPPTPPVLPACTTLLATNLLPTASRSDKIKVAYCLVLRREPDSLGLDFYTRINPKPIAEVIKDLLYSDEFKLNFLNNTSITAINNETFIQTLYVYLLNRSPDDGGRKYWMELVNQKSRDDILKSFLDSSEFTNRLGGL